MYVRISFAERVWLRETTSECECMHFGMDVQPCGRASKERVSMRLVVRMDCAGQSRESQQVRSAAIVESGADEAYRAHVVLRNCEIRVTIRLAMAHKWGPRPGVVLVTLRCGIGCIVRS